MAMVLGFVMIIIAEVCKLSVMIFFAIRTTMKWMAMHFESDSKMPLEQPLLV